MMVMAIKPCAIPAVVLILCLASCDMTEGAIAQTGTVTLIAPGAPEGAAFPGSGVSPSWAAHWYGADGTRKSETGIVDRREIIMDRGFATPVILVPEAASGPLPAAALRRSGALYPAHAEARVGDVELRADYLRGIAATCAESAMLRARGGFGNGQLIVSRFNWGKFDERLSGIGDPGLLDSGRFVSALLDGKMSVYDVTPLKKRACRVDPSSGTIRPGTAFEPGWVGGTGFTWPDSGTISLELPEGTFYFLSPDGFLTVDSRDAKRVISLFTVWSLQD